MQRSQAQRSRAEGITDGSSGDIYRGLKHEKQIEEQTNTKSEKSSENDYQQKRDQGLQSTDRQEAPTKPKKDKRGGYR